MTLYKTPFSTGSKVVNLLNKESK